MVFRSILLKSPFQSGLKVNETSYSRHYRTGGETCFQWKQHCINASIRITWEDYWLRH